MSLLDQIEENWHVREKWFSYSKNETTLFSITFCWGIFCPSGVLQILVILSRCVEKTRKGICSHHLLAPFCWSCFTRIIFHCLDVPHLEMDSYKSILYLDKPFCSHFCLCCTRVAKMVMISALIREVGYSTYLLKRPYGYDLKARRLLFVCSISLSLYAYTHTDFFSVHNISVLKWLLFCLHPLLELAEEKFIGTLGYIDPFSVIFVCLP